MPPYNKIDSPHSVSVQNTVIDNPIIEDRTYLLEEGQDNVYKFGDYFAINIGLEIIRADFLSNLHPDDPQFYVVPDGWAKRLFVNLEVMKTITFQKDIVYFLELPNFIQTVFISALNEGETITIQHCRGYNSALALQDWEYSFDNINKNTSDIQHRLNPRKHYCYLRKQSRHHR